MDSDNPTLTESSNVNGSVRRGYSGPGSGGSGPHLHISAPLPGSPMARPISLMDGSRNQSVHGIQMAPSGVQVHTVHVIVNKVEGGYGMNVSGDNPVFVQYVKPGGAAEKAGLHIGDKIVGVNGKNVTSAKHTEVVALIRASSQVILTVQKRTGVPPQTMGSPNPELRPHTIHNPSNRITEPQPVDNEHQYQLQRQKEEHYRLMIEKEQRYVDSLRSDIAKSPDEKKCKELEKTESRIVKLQMLLNDHTRNSNELHSISLDKADSPPPPLPTTPPPKFLLTKLTSKATRSNNNGNNSPGDDYSADNPPPLPKRNLAQNKDADNNNGNKLSVSGSEESDKNRGRCSSLGRRHHTVDGSQYTRMVDNVLYQHHVPSGNQSATGAPPLPPRYPPLSCPLSQDHHGDAANSINKQMSYPLVATCATIINNYPSSASNNTITSQTNLVLPHTHQCTKSNSDTLGTAMSSSKRTTDASQMLIACESMSNSCGGGGGYEPPRTPPGTPPPPYPSPTPGRKCYSNRSSGGNGLLDDATLPDGVFENNPDASSPDISPLRGHPGRIIANSSPIHAANPQTTQEMIMSMEDEDISDQEIIQMEDHGSFKSLSKLWESTPHLAVFMNYILSNSDPNSLLFYLLTDLYKEGNTKEMRKWAYEIHSCFLVPGAPLPLNNVDEQIAREIDDVLQREYDKEEILRRIFWKARNLAKQELQRQLAAFQQKRTAGLSTMYGPPDAYLTELRNDRAKELKMYETVLINKLEPYLKELEEDNYDNQKYIMAAALTTVVTRVFGVRPPSQDLDRCPTFVNKEKSFRTKLGIRFSRKLNILGHHFVAQPYFTVIRCNNCLQIICGISPQGYECSACHINLHRHCVRSFDDACPGPINNKKDRGMLNFIERIKPDKPEKDQRRKFGSNFHQREREECIAQNELGETKPGNPVSRSGSDRRPDAVREESQQQQQHLQQCQSQLPPDQQNQHQRVNSTDHAHSNDADPFVHPDSSTSLPPSSGNRDRSGKISRTASLKEKQTDKKTQSKKPRNVSDPLTSRHDNDQAEFTLTQSGGSSGSSSNSLRVSSISPSSSIDAGGGLHDIQHGIANDSDLDVGYELPDWSANISHDTLAALTGEEKKRQELINEFFHTEQYHLRKLKILDKIFYGPLTHKKVFNECDMNLIFANLPELVEIHSCFSSTMKAKRKENPLVGDVGDFIFNMFDSPKGDELQRAAATFCERQHLALELITERRKKDQRVEAALASCEKSHHCERQNLQSFMSAEMHRITRYPILIQRLIETAKKLYSERTDEDSEPQSKELEKLRLALTRCKEIVNNVNETVRTASNRSKLQEIQNHLEILIEKQIESSGLRHEHNMFVSEYKNLDLTKYTLIREDKVELLRTNRNPINLQMLLLEEAVVFLVLENEKYTLKFIQSGIPATPFLAPIIKVPSFIVRLNAARNTTIFLLNLRAESTQMYELRAKSRNDRDVWFKQLSDAAEAYNRRESGRLRSRTDPTNAGAPLTVGTSPTTPAAGGTPPSSATDGNDDSMLADLMSSSASPTLQRKAVTPERSDAANATQTDCSTASSSLTDMIVNRRNNVVSVGSNRYRDTDDLDDKRLSQPDIEEGTASHTSAVGGGVMVKLEADDWSLVQPSEVQVAVPPVHTAQPVLTPLEKIKRKDEEVRQALADKRVLVADLLSIPLQDYHHIADMVSSESQKTADSEPTELVLAAVHQVDILLNLMNESLNVNETDLVNATGGRHSSCTSNATVIQQQQNSTNHVPSVPVHRLQSIVPLLSTQLTNLLSLTKQGEEEKMILRKELQRTRELLQLNTIFQEADAEHLQEFCQSGDLERIDKTNPQGQPTLSAHPARFSPEDKYSRERITIKKRFNILMTQQPEPVF